MHKIKRKKGINYKLKDEKENYGFFSPLLLYLSLQQRKEEAPCLKKKRKRVIEKEDMN